MTSTEELRLDAEELRKLVETAQRQRVKNVLSVELRKIETEITFKEEELKKQNDSQNVARDPAQAVQSSQSWTPTIEVKTYAWDQSDKFMKIYATVPGVESVPKEQVTCHFGNRTFSLRCEHVQNKNYTCKVDHLMEDIVAEESYIKIKTDTVLVMLKKKEAKKTWPYMTLSEKKIKDKTTKKPAFDDTKDPSDSLMGMMKQMYDDGDDEMKRTIAKAWSESREKQTGAGMLG